MCASMNVLARHEPAPTEENPLTYIEDLSTQLEAANAATRTHTDRAAEHLAEATNVQLLIMEHLDLGGATPHAITVVEQLLTDLRRESYTEGYLRALAVTR